MTKLSWRKIAAVPAVIALSLGGALFASAPANAAGIVSVSSPTQGSTTDSRTVTVVGQAPANARVDVRTGPNGTLLGRTQLTGGATAFSIPVAYGDNAPTAQTIYVDGLNGGSGFSNPPTISFAIPVVTTFKVTSPTEGQTVTSRTVTVTGTGTPGSTVSTLRADGTRFAPANAVVGNDGTWTATGTFAANAPVNQSIRSQQTTGGAGRGDITTNIVLPSSAVVVPPVVVPPVVTAPVVTAPAVTAPAATAPVAVRPTASNAGTLASTGTDIAPIVGGSALLLLLGAGLAFFSRRRAAVNS